MKIFNVILAVIIIGLAGTSIYYASTLHTKRYQLKARGDLLSSALAKDSDKGFFLKEKNFVKEFDNILSIETKVNDADFHHTIAVSKIDQTSKTKLIEQYEAFVKYRETALTSLNEISDKLELLASYDQANYGKVTVPNGKDGIKFAAPKLAEGATALTMRDNNVMKEIEAMAKNMDVFDANAALLANRADMSGANTLFDTFNTNAVALVSAIAAYEQKFNEIATIVGANRPDYSGDYSVGIQGIVEKCQAVVEKISNLDGQIAKLKVDIDDRIKEIAAKDEQIIGLQKALASTRKTEKELFDVINLPVPAPLDWMKDAERYYAQMDLKKIEYGAMDGFLDSGIVMDVDYDAEYIVVDMGKNAYSTQSNTAQTKKPTPIAGAGYELIVARGQETGKLVYVGKVKIVHVEEDYSIANIIRREKGNIANVDGAKVNIQKGDRVWLAPTALENIVSVSKKVDEPAADATELDNL